MPETDTAAVAPALRFFEYRQNNSGGFFEGPADFVVIEAPNAQTADAIAQLHGVYFNGVATGRDCGCCGDRWSTAWDEGSASPAQYTYSSAMVVYADGRIVRTQGGAA